MASITFLLGRTRDRRRRALRVEQWSGIDRLGRPNFLFVTDSARKKAVVQEEFVRYRQAASFLPEVATFAEIESRLAGRYVGGRAIWTEGAIAVWLAHTLTHEEAPHWLRNVGSPARTSPRLAKAFMAWDAAARPPLPGLRGALLEPWFRSIAARLDEDPARRTRYSALTELIEALDAPSQPLLHWLRRTGLVVVDDVLNPPPLDRAVLVALARAWATAGTHVAISFECGLGDGEAVEARYFGAAEGEERLSPTLTATARVRRACFEGLIAEFGADVTVAGPEFSRSSSLGPLFANVEAADPTDVWGTHEPAESEGLSFSSWPDPEAEVRAIAHAVRLRIEAGLSASEVGVAFPGLPAYSGLVRRVFGEVGVPIQVSRGEPVLSLPGARALAGALRASLRMDEPEIVLEALADAPTVDRPAAFAFRLVRLARERGLAPAPMPEWLAQLYEADPEVQGALTFALDPLIALASAPEPAAWLAALSALVLVWGLQSAPEPSGNPPQQAGVSQVLAEAERLVAEATAARAPLAAPALAELLLSRLKLLVSADRAPVEGAVAIMGMLELRGVHPRACFIGGLVAEDYPTSTGEDWVLDPTSREALELTDSMAQARYLLGSAIRNAVNTVGHTLHLSWPRMRARKFVLPSPVVEELLATRTAHGSLRDRVFVGEAPEGRFGAAEWERAAARAGSPPWTGNLPGGLAAHGDAVLARQASTFGDYDGDTGGAPREGAVSVTSFETFLACPARFFYDQVLGVDEEEPWDPDLPAMANGALLHRVLQRFLVSARLGGLASLQTPEPASQSRLVTLLSEAAAAEVEADPEIARLRPSQRAWLLREWCSGLSDGGQAGLLRSWLDQETAAVASTVVAVERPLEVELGNLRLAGRVDRVDELGAHALLVLDHKTGQVPVKKVRLGLKVQGVLYARALATAERPEVASGYAGIRGPGDVKRGAWAGPEALVKTLAGPRVTPLVTDGEAGEALSQWLLDSARRLAEGRFHPSVADPALAGCGYCPHSTYCRRDEARAVAAAADPSQDLQRPFVAPARA